MLLKSRMFEKYQKSGAVKKIKTLALGLNCIEKIEKSFMLRNVGGK